MYPYDPDDPDYLSIYQVGFKGCFQCGKVGHYDRAQFPLKNYPQSFKAILDGVVDSQTTH